MKVWTSDHHYYLLKKKKWRGISVKNSTYKNYAIDFEKQILKLNRKTLDQFSVVYSNSSFFSISAHKEFFQNESVLHEKYFENFEQLCKENGFLDAWKFLNTEAGGVWRWENNWPYSYKRLFQERDTFLQNLPTHPFEDNNNELLDALLILGLPPTPSKKDIKKAFNKKSFVFHPDFGGNTRQFIKLNEAKETVKNILNIK